MDWRSYGSEAECRVGEVYKSCLSGDIDSAIKVDNDTLLIPYDLVDEDFWESYRIVKECYLNASSIRLHFEVYDFLGLREGDVVEVGG